MLSASQRVYILLVTYSVVVFYNTAKSQAQAATCVLSPHDE